MTTYLGYGVLAVAGILLIIGLLSYFAAPTTMEELVAGKLEIIILLLAGILVVLMFFLYRTL